ncbi:MAG: hypothetical protein PVG78_02550 [Desulfobacterales bacterium]|jgi:outer membrane protein assembly factor BamE (lipoprotein component of BamABCDE complex)
MKVHRTFFVLLTAIALSSCIPWFTQDSVPDPATVIRVGMTEEAVIDRLGEPQLVDPYQVGKYIYYYPAGKDGDCINDKASCTPVVLQNGRVVAVGRRSISGAPGTKAPAAAQAPKPRPIDAQTRREIERLERQVSEIPSSRTMDNLRIYRYLLKLDPTNVQYRQKVAYYEAQYRREEEDQREQLRREREDRRKRQNEVLSRFEGNDRLQMALENLGNGRFYVRLRYSGTYPIEIRPEQFTLRCKDGRRYACYQCRDLAVRVDPGGSAEGRISFDTYADPSELVFSHPATGTVRRVFPDL